MILITGAGGTVGSEVVRHLQTLQQPLRLAFHSQHKVEQAAAAGHDVVMIDYLQPETLSAALAGAEAVFLMGNGVLGQAEGEINVVKAAQAAGVQRIVKLSVWGADSDAFMLARLHNKIERAIVASGLEWTMLRPNSFMQNFITYDLETIVRDGAFYLPAGDAAINHIDIRDIAQVATLALTQPGHAGQVYNLSGPRAITYAEAAAILSRTIGKTVHYVEISDAEARAALLESGAPEEYADTLVDLNRFFRTGGAAEGSTTVRELTAREPISFEQFARDHIDWFVAPR